MAVKANHINFAGLHGYVAQPERPSGPHDGGVRLALHLSACTRPPRNRVVAVTTPPQALASRRHLTRSRPRRRRLWRGAFQCPLWSDLGVRPTGRNWPNCDLHEGRKSDPNATAAIFRLSDRSIPITGRSRTSRQRSTSNESSRSRARTDAADRVATERPLPNESVASSRPFAAGRTLSKRTFADFSERPTCDIGRLKPGPRKPSFRGS